jgi:hypothetical protein
LRDEADQGSGRTVLGDDVVTVSQDDAPGRVDDPADYVDQRRLSGAVRPQQGEDLPAADLKVDVLERLQAGGIGLGEIGHGDYGLQEHLAFNQRL